MNENNPVEKVSIKKVLWVSFVVNILDVITGVVVAALTGSVIMLAQALEGITDLASSGLLLLGLSRSRKEADSSHPFGYGRELYFWTLISALIMLSITSTFTFYFGLQRFLHPEVIQSTYLAYIVLIFTAITNSYALSLSVRRLLKGRSINSLAKSFYHSSFIETKTSFVLDLMGFSASILGLISLSLYTITGNQRFDGFGAMVIGIFLAILSVILLSAVKDFLIGRGVSINTTEIIKNAAERLTHVKSVQDLKASHIGPEEIMINIEINAADNLTTDELEVLIDKVKGEIQKDLPSAKHIQVELESQ